mgnify:CR=1 FL=1
MKTAVIIINWNGLQDTMECIESLELSAENSDIIVVDNRSLNSEAGKIRLAHPNITVISLDKNYGFSYANNRGMELALSRNNDAILLLNNDTVVTKNFLEPLKRASQKNPQAGILTPKILFFQTDKIWAAGGAINYLFARGTNRGEGRLDRQVEVNTRPDFISGCCMYIPAKVARQIRFDERYFLYYEDSDISFQARQLGYQLLYVPESTIYHKSGRSSGSLLSYRRIYYLSRNKLLFVRQRFSLKQKIIFWTCYPFQTILMFLYFIIKAPKKLSLPLIRAWTKGACDYFKNRFGPLLETHST